MKSLIQATVIAAIFAAPAISFAQSDVSLTREQVKAELVQFEQNAPRTATGHDPYYPAATQAAQAHVAAGNGGATALGGASSNGSSASGSRAAVTTSGTKPIYFGQ